MNDELIELLDQHYQKSQGRFRKGEHTSEDLMMMMLKHQTNHIEHLDIDLKDDIKSVNTTISRVEKDVQSKINDVQSELSDTMWKMVGCVFSLLVVTITVLKLT